MADREPTIIDTALSALILSAEHGTSTRLTLFVGGAVVAGEIVSPAEFFAAFAPGLPPGIAEAFAGLAAQQQARIEAEDTEARSNPELVSQPRKVIYLRNAMLIDAQGNERPLAWWVGRADEVSGLALR